MIRWADVRFAHRFAGGPAPVRKYGIDQMRASWLDVGRTGLAAVIAVAVMAGLVWFAGITFEPFRSTVGLLGLILGIVALVQSKKAGRGNGFAIAAIIIGGISVIVGLIVIFAVIVPSLNAATTCLNDPTAVVQVWGVDLSCQEVLEQSNR